jgi:hypothetical protein
MRESQKRGQQRDNDAEYMVQSENVRIYRLYALRNLLVTGRFLHFLGSTRSTHF